MADDQATDDFLEALRDLLADGISELTADGVVVWHHGESDVSEDIKAANGKCKGVSLLIYDLGGDGEDDSDMIRDEVAIELYVDTSKRRGASLRKGGAIRDDIMRLVHRNSALRNNAPNYDTRVRGYRTLADPDFAAWRITVSRFIYLDP